MDINKSNVVPFAVIGPVSGRDITDRIILKDIISEGTTVPYFKSNGDDTFSVVNAETTQTVTNTTFKFDVEENGVNYQLEAKTKMTVKPVVGGTFKVVMKTQGIIGRTNQTKTFDYVPTWQGLPQTVDQVKFVITGLEGIITITNEVLLPDGITHRVTCNITSTSAWNNYYQFRFERTGGVKTVKNDGYQTTQGLLLIDPVANKLTVVSPYYYTDNVLTAAVGDKVRIYPAVYYNGVIVPLNDPGLVITKSNKGGGLGADVLSIESTTKDFIQMSVIGPVSTTLKAFTWTYTYLGQSIDVTGGITVPTATSSVIPMAFQNSLIANVTQKSIFNPIKPTLTWTPYWTVDDALFESGTGVFIDKRTGYPLTPAFDLAGLTADAVNRFVKTVTPSWMEQEFRITGVLGLVRGANVSTVSQVGRNPVPINPTSITVPMAPYTVNVITPTVNKTLNVSTAVIANLTQMRDGALTKVPGVISDVTVTGAGTYSSSSISANGDIVINVLGTGSPGEISISGKVTESRVPYPFTFGVKTDVVGVTTSAVTIKTKIWETGTSIPFTVTESGINVTPQISDVKLIPTSYVKAGANGSDWEIINADTTETTTSVQYTFVYNGITYSATGKFQLEAWDGKTITIDGLPTQLLATVGRLETVTFTGTYKGKPHKSFTVKSLGDADAYIGTLTSTPVVGGSNVVFGYIGKSVKLNTPFSYVVTVDGTPGLTEGIDKLTIPGNIASVYAVGLRLNAMSPTALTNVNGFKSYPITIEYYDGSRKLASNDPGLVVGVIPGVDEEGVKTQQAAEILSVNGDIFNFGIMFSDSNNAEYHNQIQATYNGNTLLTPLNIYYGPSQVVRTMSLSWDAPATPASSNDLTGRIKFSDGTPIPNLELYNVAFTSFPVEGNSLIAVTKPLEFIDQSLGTVKVSMDLGHTGDSVWVNGTGHSSMGGDLYLRGSPLNVQQSPLFDKAPLHEFSSGNNDKTVIKFNLHQKRFEDPEFQITSGELYGPMNWDGKGMASNFKSGVTDGNFEFTMQASGSEGLSNASFKLKVDGIVYPVVINCIAVVKEDDAVLTLDQTKFSGLYDETFITPFIMDKDGSPVDLTDVRVRVSPAGIINTVTAGPEGLSFKLTKNLSTTVTDNVKVIIISNTGIQASETIEVTTLNNLLRARPENRSTSGVGNNQLWFALTDAKGNPVVDAVLSSISQDIDDADSVWNFPIINQFTPDPATPGRYSINAVINWRYAIMNVTATVKQNNTEKSVVGLIWEIKTAPITTEISPETIIKDVDDFTLLILRFKQERWSGVATSEYLGGTYDNVTLTGDGVLGDPTTPSGTVFGVKVKGNGGNTPIKISGHFVANNPTYDFGTVAFEITPIDNPVVLTITKDKISTFSGEDISIGYTLTKNGNSMDSAGTTALFTPGNDIAISRVIGVSKIIDLQVTKLPQPENSIVNTVLTLSVSGPWVKAPLEITVYGNKVNYKPVSNLVLTPVEINNVVFSLTGQDNKPATGVTFGTVSCRSDNDAVVISLPAEVKESETIPGQYSFNVRATAVSGKGEVTIVATYKGINTVLTGTDLTYTNPGTGLVLTQVEGFQTTGTGDINNPVTLTQSTELVTK